MSGGYSRVATAQAISQYFERLSSDRPGASVICIDLIRGWVKLTPYALSLLEIYLRRSEEPPSDDPDKIRDRIKLIMNKNNDGVQPLIDRLRKVLALNQLGREIAIPETKDRLVLTGIGAARNQQCDVCGRYLESGRAWRDLANDVAWCGDHGRRREIK